jgi:protein-S-isoprenylcysteine O-methyltransferase Ste14
MNETIKTKPLMTPNLALLKMLFGIIASLLLIAVLIFAGAGHLYWMFGWLFVVVWGLLKIIFIFLLRWHDPDLLVERATALDGGRFRWSGAVPVSLILIAYLIYLLGNGLAAWAVSANPFFSSESRIQAERGQRVTCMGPYRFVRHPAYLSTVLMWPVTGLLLESWYSTIPGLLAALMMLIRTINEDRMLLAELTGYKEYANEVRYRLFPGIW